MIESLVVFIVDLAARKLTTASAEAELQLIQGTNLIKIAAKVPGNFADRFRDFPGSHVYVSIPVASRSGSFKMLYEFMFNPFTVAAVNENSQELTLVARQLKGPMSRTFGDLASRSMSGIKVPLSIEGPYGSSRYLPSLIASQVDRVLLVAGGVGATFIMPIYQYLASELPTVRIDLVWAIREAGEATWASSGTEKSILDDDRIQLFLTGNIFNSSSNAGNAENSEIEMERIPRSRGQGKTKISHNAKRPDFQKIVDDVFRHDQGERIAILVCGSDNMARELRRHVGIWVKKGREVWWHNENFSW